MGIIVLEVSPTKKMIGIAVLTVKHRATYPNFTPNHTQHPNYLIMMGWK